jgi:hypothetical protein
MPSGLRRRFWLESICGSVTGIVAVITLFWHDWIEAVFRMDPDSGNGSAEWLIVLVLLLATVTLASGARHEWRRAELAAMSAPRTAQALQLGAYECVTSSIEPNACDRDAVSSPWSPAITGMSAIGADRP